MIDRGNPAGIWWQASLVYAFLLDAGEDTARQSAILTELVEHQADWASTNFDATASSVYQALCDFLEDHPEALDLEEVDDFFGRLQRKRGATPHFRIELLQARLRQRLYEERSSEDDLRHALAHVNRALILNPRLSEGHDLRVRLQRLAREVGGLSKVWSAPATSQATEAGLPADPVEAVEQIRVYYQRMVGGLSSSRDVDDYFARNSAEARGLVLVQLVQEHARFLLQRERSADAAQLLISHVLGQEPSSGVRSLLRLLQDAWFAQRLSFEQVAAQVERLRPRVAAEELYYLSLILARFAFEERRYDLALVYAQESDQVSANADAQRLLERARKMLDERERAAGKEAVYATPSEGEVSADEKRRVAKENLERVAYTQEDQGPIELILDAMADPAVGPWLVLQVITGEIDVGLAQADKHELVSRAQAVASQPSLDLFQADVAVHWGDNSSFSNEGQLPRELLPPLEEFLTAGDADRAKLLPMLIKNLGSRPWCAFAVLDGLSRQFAEDAAIRWARSIAARRLKRAEDYVDSALRCIDEPSVPGATFPQVANDLLGLGLPGLALGMALISQETTAQKLVPLAEKECRLLPWQWPACLHEAKDRHADERWVEAADAIIRVLLAAPEHWPACRTFSEVFSRPFEEDPVRTRRALELAEAVVGYLQQRHHGGSPELLVLQAELRQHREGLGGRRLIRSGTINELNDLCVSATRLRANFQPALAMLKHLRAAESTPIAEGATFFDYQIERHLGAGSFGHVYRASVLKPMQDRPSVVALKFVRPDAPTEEKRQQRIKSLRREAQIACRLDHACIVRTYEFVDDRCLVMQFIDGQTLEDKIDQRVRYPWQWVAQIGLQIAQALRHADEVAMEVVQGEGSSERRPTDFAHRDIHPKNIMVIEEQNGAPHAYLLDFGLARLPGGTMTSLVKDVNKRLHYRDPSYPRGDFRGDMFSLGVILYELLCSEGPYPIDRYCDFLAGQPRDFDTQPKLVGLLLPQGVQQPPVAFQGALRKMVGFKPADRYENWDLLIDILTSLLDNALTPIDTGRSHP